MTRPHIIIFNPDQWRGDVLGHVGNTGAITPHLDRIAVEDAVSFRNAFCQNPVCTPSRISYMTGQYPHVHGHRTMHHLLREGGPEPMLLRNLKEHGYHVFWGGKNHLIADQSARNRYAQSWSDDSRYSLDPHWHGPVYEAARGTPGSDTYYSFFIGRMQKKTGADYYHDGDWMHVMEAIRFIRERPRDRPLCVYLPLVYPHPPYGVEEPFFSAIDREKLPARRPAPEDWQKKPSILREIHRRLGMEGWTETRWDELRATYYGMCMRVDALFGELVTVLKDEGLYDETALFMFSDHGDFAGDYGLVEKTQNTFEDCLTRVPFIIKLPRELEVLPRIDDSLVELVDFSETVYDLVAIDPPYTRNGRSLLPLLAGGVDQHREAVFCEGGRLAGEQQSMEKESRWTEAFTDNPYWPRLSLQEDDNHPYHTKAVMCRTKEFKYVRRLYEQDELYHLIQDPGELVNLIDEPGYMRVKEDFTERLLTWYMATADAVPYDPDPIDWGQ